MRPRAEPAPLRVGADRLFLAAGLLLVPKCCLCLGAWLGVGMALRPEMCGAAASVAPWIHLSTTALLLGAGLVLRLASGQARHRSAETRAM